MRAAVMTGYGGNEVVEVRDVPKPVPSPGEVLVEVRAASVNPLDFKIRDGKLRLLRSYRFPLVMGNDLAGVVAEGGTRFRPGDRVYARLDKTRIGAFAEYAVVREEDLARAPSGLSFAEAASLPLAGLTAWQALFEAAGLKFGQRVLIHAGAGGVGTLAIQLAKSEEIQVAATASGAGLDLVRRLGADVVIDYRNEKFEEKVRDYDAVLDSVGGETLERSFAVLKKGGIVVSIAGPPEEGTAQDMGAGLLIRALFFFLSRKVRRLARRHGARYRYIFMKPSGEQLARLAGLVEEGRLKPVIDRIFPLEQAKEALAYVETGRAKGKVVIALRP